MYRRFAMRDIYARYRHTVKHDFFTLLNVCRNWDHDVDASALNSHWSDVYRVFKSYSRPRA
jgi:hypothetical protein